MIYGFNKAYFKAQVVLLRLFKPTLLFDKINQLDWYQNTLRQWVDDQQFSPNSKVLEVGCASGAITSYMAKLGYLPTGVDFSADMIELAQAKNKQIDFLEADVLDLPFDTNSFDGVIAASLINIVADKSKAMSELARVCKKGGTVTILVPLAGFTDDSLHSLQASLGNSGFSYAAMDAWHRLPPKMEISQISTLFKQAGLLEITTSQYLQGMVVAASAMKA